MKFKIFLLPLLILLLLCSCVVTQSINLVDNSATSTLEANDFLSSVLEDLSCWDGDDSDSAFLEVAVKSLAQSIAASDFSNYVYITKNSDDCYAILFGFTDFKNLIDSLSKDKNQNIVTITKIDNETKLDFNLSLENYETLKEMIPLLADPNFEAYGPIYNNPPYDFRTEEDYLYMMEFIFGEGARTIADATISISIDTPTAITSTTGVLVTETNTIFKLRLIDFLLLHEPIKFSCTF